MVRITIRFIKREVPLQFLAKERRVYVRGDCTHGQAEKIVERFKAKFPGVDVTQWFRDDIYKDDVEPGAVFVEKEGR